MAKLKKNVTGYGRTPNVLLNDNTVSLKAKGLFAYMESKPDDWEFSIRKLQYAVKESADAIATGLKELETTAYLSRRKYKDEKGHWGIEYTLYDKPTMTGKPLSGKPKQGKPSLGKPPQPTKKVVPNINIQKKVVTHSVLPTRSKTGTDISKLYYEVIKALDLPIRNHNTLRAKIVEMSKDPDQTKMINYLVFMRDKYAGLEWSFKPAVNDALDIHAKRTQIRNTMHRELNPNNTGPKGIKL